MTSTGFKPKTLLNEKSVKAKQPEDTKLTLFPHQLTMLHRVEEIEESFGTDAPGYGILADQPGAGKTFVMLAMILNDKRKLEAEKQKGKAHKDDYRMNFIVVPHNIFEQWAHSIERFSDELTYKKITYQDMIDYETLFDIQTAINRQTLQKVVKSRTYYDVYLIPSTLYHPMVATMEANIIVEKDKKGNEVARYENFPDSSKYRRIIFDEIDTIANLLVHAIQAERTWFMSASFTPSRMGVYQSYFSIDASTSQDFDPTYVCKCDDEYVFRNMQIPEPQKFNIECYNPILDKIVSKIPYFTKDDMKAINAYDYSQLNFQFVKRVPNNEDQLLSYATKEFEEVHRDAIEKVKYYKENIRRMQEIDEERFDRHDAVYDFVEDIIPTIKSLAHVIHSFKSNPMMMEMMAELNELLKDDSQKKSREILIKELKKGTYISGLTKLLQSKSIHLENTQPYYMERYVDYIMMEKGNYPNLQVSAKASSSEDLTAKEMLEITSKYDKLYKKVHYFMIQVETDYSNFIKEMEKFRLIDALFQKYNSIMDKSQISSEEKETVIKIMKNMIEYYKKLNMLIQNSYYTFETAGEALTTLDQFTKTHQTNRRMIALHEVFEEQARPNRQVFAQETKNFLTLFETYKEKLKAGLPTIKSMLGYVENYDNLKLYVDEFVKYTHVEKHYGEYLKTIRTLTEEHMEKRNRDPITYESAIREIIQQQTKAKAESSASSYVVEMEITKLDLIYHLMRLFKEGQEQTNTQEIEKEEEESPSPSPVVKKRGRKSKAELEAEAAKAEAAKAQAEAKAKAKSANVVEKREPMPKVKMMIFSDFSSIFKKITPLCDRLDIKYVQLDGGNMRSIEMAVRQYKYEDAQILFCDSTLFGCGMNFENTTHVIFTHTPNPETQKQIIGRAQRIGRESVLQVYQLHYPNEEMFNVIKKDTDSHVFHFMTAMKDSPAEASVEDMSKRLEEAEEVEEDIEKEEVEVEADEDMSERLEDEELGETDINAL